MNTDAEMENVADRLNSKLDSGSKAEAKKKTHYMKNLTGRHFPSKNINLEIPENECLPPDYLLARMLSVFSLSYIDKILETDTLASLSFPA